MSEQPTVTTCPTCGNPGDTGSGWGNPLCEFCPDRIEARQREQDDEPGDLPLPQTERKLIRARIVGRRKRPDLVLKESTEGADVDAIAHIWDGLADPEFRALLATQLARTEARFRAEKLRQENKRLLQQSKALFTELKRAYDLVAIERARGCLSDTDEQAAVEELRLLREVADADWEEQRLRALTAQGQRFDEEFSTTWATAVNRHDAALAAWRTGREGQP